MDQKHSHKMHHHCHTCKELKRSYSFGVMGQVIPDTMQTWINAHKLPYSLESVAKGLAGFEELKKYIKQGNEFCRDVALLMQERADVESAYCKGLSKVATKLLKLTQSGLGTLTDGWKNVSIAMEQEVDLHKNLANALIEDISKPLKHLQDNQYKARKPIEESVSRSLRSLTDKRNEEMKAKKSVYDAAKSHEKAEEAKHGKSKTEKDINKTEKKQKQMHDSLRKADKHYCECCEKAEVARQEWEFAVNKSSAQLQVLEEERLTKLSEYLNQYDSHLSVLGPRLTESCEKLHRSVLAVDLGSDIRNVSKQRGSGPYIAEQILIDCYAEDKQFTMKMTRRKEALQHYLVHLGTSISREEKGREGLEKLLGVYNENNKFVDKESLEDSKQRYNQLIFMTNFLEANHFKMASNLADLEGSSKPTHKFSRYIESTRDKQGMCVSILKVPANQSTEGHTGYDVTNVTIGALACDEPFDDDEFDDDTSSPEPTTHQIIGRCRALYDYVATQPDELSISEGNIINIYDRQPDGWWQGELKGRVGMFPQTYVQEL